jgi:hypothetical protein
MSVLGRLLHQRVPACGRIVTVIGYSLTASMIAPIGTLFTAQK